MNCVKNIITNDVVCYVNKNSKKKIMTDDSRTVILVVYAWTRIYIRFLNKFQLKGFLMA